MGNYVSRYFSHNREINNVEAEIKDMNNCPAKNETNFEEDCMRTPPVIHKIMNMDPRSATSGINRTPIELDSTPIGLNRRVLSAIPKHLRNKQYLETDIDKVMLCLSSKEPSASKDIMKLQTSDNQYQNASNRKETISAIDKERYEIFGLDPRSPAANFDRTPILLPKSIERLRARSQETLQRRGSYEADMFHSDISYCEMLSEFDIIEIQALPDMVSNAIKSLDLDVLDSNNKINELCSSHSNSNDSFSENDNEITVIKDSKCSDNKVFIQEDKIEQKEISINDNDIIQVWKDSLVLDKSKVVEIITLDNSPVIEKKIPQVAHEEIIVSLDDDSIAKDTLSLKLSKCDGDKIKSDGISKKKKAFNSQDEMKSYISAERNENECTKIRTPLSNRSNNEQVQTSFANSPQPVFRSKGRKTKMLQENTPPHKKYVPKSKLSGIQ